MWHTTHQIRASRSYAVMSREPMQLLRSFCSSAAVAAGIGQSGHVAHLKDAAENSCANELLLSNKSIPATDLPYMKMNFINLEIMSQSLTTSSPTIMQ